MEQNYIAYILPLQIQTASNSTVRTRTTVRVLLKNRKFRTLFTRLKYAFNFTLKIMIIIIIIKYAYYANNCTVDL